METATGESISLSLRIAKAMALARAGRLRDAQKVVADERTIPDDMLALHALAALVTSEGDYLRALKLWELLLQRDPGHAEARRMIEAIEVWLIRPSWFRYLPAIGGVAAVLVAGLIFVLATSTPKSATVAPRGPAVVEEQVQPHSSTLPAGINADFGPVTAPGRSAQVEVTPTPLPPITFSVPAPAAKKKRGGR